MKTEDKIIEKGKQSLSFVEQLQNQIQLCREALSEYGIPITPRVEALEGLLWAKLKDDEDYQNKIKEINKEFARRCQDMKAENSNLCDWQIEEALIPYKRARAKEQFKAIMVFIDKKGYMPIGEEDE